MAKVCKPAIALYVYVHHPGAKLLFMGNEFAQTRMEYKTELAWELLQFDPIK